MPTKIITKNGSGVPAGGALDQGELAVDLTNKKLYSSTDGTDVVEIAPNTPFNGQFADGSDTAPSITFASDTDCGFYNNPTTANAFGVAAAGQHLGYWSYGSGAANYVMGDDFSFGFLPAAGNSAIRMATANSFAASIEIWSTATTSVNAMQFGNSNGLVGTIVTSGSSTAYNTSSDYRLKENVVDLTNAVSRLSQIPVHRFNFISEPSKTVDGFLAHEVQAIVPEAVYGDKDATKVDPETGDVVPVYQGIDQSKLVPLLVAAVQELTARIEALEAP